jgi:preprotein translocase subunit SecY
MLQSLLNAWKLPDVRKKVLFTAIIIAIYRLGCYIPAPGINIVQVKAAMGSSAGGVLDFYNLFSGGGLNQMAIFAMGIMPYITASIIMQLLTMVIPSLEQMMKEGESGQKKVNQYTRYFTVVLAFIEAIGFVFLFRNQYHAFTSNGQTPLPDQALRVWLVILTLTVGTGLVMWMGELITQRGIGNGISLMIFASIISRLPSGLNTLYHMNAAYWFFMAVVAVAVIAGVVYVTEGQRRIPIQYAKRVVGRKTYGGQSTYLPLKINMAGVIPVIFASSVLLFPVTIGRMLPGWPRTVAAAIGPTTWGYVGLEVLLIVAFTYFYTAVQFNPIDQADNLKKYGGFIPGIRPGRPTAEYLDRVLTRITLPGAMFLAVVVLVPEALYRFAHVPFYFGGTSLLIVVGVALDTMKQTEAQLLMRNYEGFLK